MVNTLVVYWVWSGVPLILMLYSLAPMIILFMVGIFHNTAGMMVSWFCLSFYSLSSLTACLKNSATLPQILTLFNILSQLSQTILLGITTPSRIVIFWQELDLTVTAEFTFSANFTVVIFQHVIALHRLWCILHLACQLFEFLQFFTKFGKKICKFSWLPVWNELPIDTVDPTPSGYCCIGKVNLFA